MQIQINVVGKIATAIGSPYLVCGNGNDTILFTFDSEWKSYAAKTARFIYEIDGEEKYTEVAFSGTTCKVPAFYNIKKVEVGVYAGELSTTRCKINCRASILDGEGSDEGSAHAEPEDDIYNRIIEICNEAVTAGNEAKEAAAGFEATTRATFGNALKGNIYGAAVRADDVSPVEHALACKVESKNLIPFPYSEKNLSRYGMTFTIDENDKGILVNGTATANTSFNWLSSGSNKVKIEKGQTYTFSCVPHLTSARGYIFLQNSLNGNVLDKLFIQQDITTFTATGTGYASVGVVVLEGATFNNEKILVQLERGSAATEYTPYIDPSTATVTRCGKNLWAQGDIEAVKSKSVYLALSAGVTYTFTADITSNDTDATTCMFGALDLDGNFKGFGQMPRKVKSSITFTPEKDVKTIVVYASENATNGDGDTATYKNIQLEVGAVSTDFETYKGVETYAPNADGTVEDITSLSPSMTLLTDTANTVIACEYNRDINAVIADLYNKIQGKGETE